MPAGPNITAVRGVFPRYACEPASFAPSYASTSVSRTATGPCRRVAPSRRGATSRTGRARTWRRSAEPAMHPIDRGRQLVELLGHPGGGGAAAAVARGHRPLDGQHRAHLGREVRRDRRQLLVGQLVELAAELLAP